MQFSISSTPCVEDGDYDSLTHGYAESLNAPSTSISISNLPSSGKINTYSSYIY